MDGDHTIARCREVTVATLVAVFEALRRHRVRLEGMLLKPNMVVAGSECPEQAGVDEVAAETLGCLRETVPAAVPGIVFSFGRALQAPVLEAWKGEPGNGPAAQRAFAHRARLNGAARLG